MKKEVQRIEFLMIWETFEKKVYFVCLFCDWVGTGLKILVKFQDRKLVDSIPIELDVLRKKGEVAQVKEFLKWLDRK